MICGPQIYLLSDALLPARHGWHSRLARQLDWQPTSNALSLSPTWLCLSPLVATDLVEALPRLGMKQPPSHIAPGCTRHWPLCLGPPHRTTTASASASAFPVAPGPVSSWSRSRSPVLLQVALRHGRITPAQHHDPSAQPVILHRAVRIYNTHLIPARPSRPRTRRLLALSPATTLEGRPSAGPHRTPLQT
jgi:hypothetical protein